MLVDNRLNKKIEYDLHIIVSEILEFFNRDQVVAIALIGGLGRGEATRLLFSSLDGEYPVLLSDYDILVLLKESTFDGRCTLLRQKLSAKIGVEVEIAAKPVNAISQLPSALSTYELSAHRILWGRGEILMDALPVIDPSRLPASEGDRLLFNRGAGLIGAAVRFRCQNLINNDDTSMFLISQCIKAILAVGDAFLIFHHCYHSSFSRKVEILSRLDLPSELKEQYQWAAQFKIASLPPHFQKANLLDWWQDVTVFFQKWHQQYEEQMSGFTWTGWDRYSITCLHLGIHRPRTYLKIFSQNIKTFGSPHSSHPWLLWSYFLPMETRLRAVMPLLLYSLVIPNERQLKLAQQLLNRKSNLFDNEMERVDLAKYYYELWNVHVG